MNKLLKIIIGILVFIFLLITGIIIAVNISPRPGAWFINKQFNHPLTIRDDENYQKAKTNVEVMADQEYTSSLDNNQFDLYLPKGADSPVPVLIWVHGGAYVGGDKRDVTEFATKIASDMNIAVVSMNYSLAPDSKYPSQLQQVDELYQFLNENQTAFPQIDFNQLFIGGDSAGAQIALQYTALQTNPHYAQEMNWQPQISKEQLKGVLSYCGPVDLKQAAENSENRLVSFFHNTVGWSLFGTKQWKESPLLQETSIVDHVTAEFPPAFVTDGNTMSFEEQGKALTNQLEELAVPVTSLFFNEDQQTAHEYQFEFGTGPAEENYELTKQFLEEQLTSSD